MVLLSKLLNLLAQPLHGVLALLLLAVLLGPRHARGARRASLAALLLLLLCGLQPLADGLLGGLEDQYPEIPLSAELQGYAGIIVLGGALEPGYLSEQRQLPLLNGSAERMTAAYAVWRLHPQMRLLFSGGEGELLGRGPSESERARRFFASMGLPAEHLLLEDRSQNTYENAVFSRQLPGVDAHQPWLLLTSAWHMPRAMGSFRKAGWNVTAYPVDFRTAGSTPWSRYSLETGSAHWELLLHECLGLLAYRLTGRL